MITEYVRFSLPAGITREEVVAGMREVAPRWQREANLVRKTFILDPGLRFTGAFYLWKDRQSAEVAHGPEWRERVLRTYGSVPEIQYFDTPLVVDDALGQVIE